MTENIQNKRKLWKDVKVGDTIYIVYFHQATTRIIKCEVTEIATIGKCIKVKTSETSHFYASPDTSYSRESSYFWRSARLTTLEEAQKECKIMTENRIKEIKKEMATLKLKLFKWEGHKAALEEGVYNIK